MVIYMLMDESNNQDLSRKERREIQRAQRDDIQRADKHKKMIRKITLWGGVAVVVLAIGWLMIRAAQNIQLPTGGSDLAVPVSSSDHNMGPANAPATLVEYSDYQCPACGLFYPLIKQVLADPQLQNKVKFVYRNFPLPQHSNARLAAQAAEAAALQGKFWQMHDMLFENQIKWSDMSSAGARGVFVGYAQSLGLNMNKFNSDIDSSAVKDKIQADVDGGNQAGINATPTFFINGKLMPQPNSYEQFRQFIVDAAG